MTAETMTGLIVGARSALRIFIPFLDARGLDLSQLSRSPPPPPNGDACMPSVGYARRRKPRQRNRAARTTRGREGRPTVLQRPHRSDRPFPHLKLISADGERAYIGSANLTWAALTSNAEIGALVEGEPVRILERWFDALIASATVPLSDNLDLSNGRHSPNQASGRSIR